MRCNQISNPIIILRASFRIFYTCHEPILNLYPKIAPNHNPKKKNSYSGFYNQKTIEFTAYITFIKYQLYFTSDDNQLDAKLEESSRTRTKTTRTPTINLWQTESIHELLCTRIQIQQNNNHQKNETLTNLTKRTILFRKKMERRRRVPGRCGIGC